MLIPRPFFVPLILLFLLPPSLASSGDRNPNFQHCLRGCSLTRCDPSQPPPPLYLRAFGWRCDDECKYDCTHRFTDNIRVGGTWHQFYGKWPFYRLGPIQEPFSTLMSLGNLYVNVRGIAEVRRRIRAENKLRRWLEVLGWVQVDTWVWSAVFHTRDTPLTERLDYFAATLTISSTLLYALLRVLSLQTPLWTSRLAIPVIAAVACLVLAHFTYLLSFPAGSFPYGYHTKFNLLLALAHNALWTLWSAAHYLPLPTVRLGAYELGMAYPYPPGHPMSSPRPKNAASPITLVALTTLAMSLELLDFPPVFRSVDAHALWHASTIPLAAAWWSFLCNDAVELERVMLGAKGVRDVRRDENMPLSGGTRDGPGSPMYARLSVASRAGTPRGQESEGCVEGEEEGADWVRPGPR